MSQVIYSGSINDQLSKTTTARIHAATNEITRLYDTKIAAAQKEIAAVQRKESSLQQQVTNSRFLSECEAGETSCSQTHKLGCGPYCKRDARRAAAAAAALKSARPQFAATIAADRRKIALWQAAETGQVANRVAHDQGRPGLPRPPGGARSGREGEPGRQEVRRVLPCLPDRDRPRRPRAQAHPPLQHRRRLRAERRSAPGDWTSSRRTACRSARPSSPAGSRSRREPRRTPTSSGSGARSTASRRRRSPDRLERSSRRPAVGGPAAAAPLGD